MFSSSQNPRNNLPVHQMKACFINPGDHEGFPGIICCQVSHLRTSISTVSTGMCTCVIPSPGFRLLPGQLLGGQISAKSRLDGSLKASIATTSRITIVRWDLVVIKTPSSRPGAGSMALPNSCYPPKFVP
jgi:hypothetical protein